MKVIYYILQAQKYSDLAKKEPKWWDDKPSKRNLYYSEKEKYIEKALVELKKARKSKIQYKIEKGPDQNGCPSNIIYFEFKVKGELYQFSFHQPRGTRKPQGQKYIKWNKQIGGCTAAYYELVGKEATK